MEPTRVSASVSQQHNKSAALRGLEALARPIPHESPIWRVAEHAVTAPVLQEAVLAFGEEHRTLRVAARSTRVQGEVEFFVERVEEGLRCRPLFGAAAVERSADGHDGVHVDEDTQLATSRAGVTERYLRACDGLRRGALLCVTITIIQTRATCESCLESLCSRQQKVSNGRVGRGRPGRDTGERGRLTCTNR